MILRMPGYQVNSCQLLLNCLYFSVIIKNVLTISTQVTSFQTVYFLSKQVLVSSKALIRSMARQLENRESQKFKKRLVTRSLTRVRLELLISFDFDVPSDLIEIKVNHFWQDGDPHTYTNLLARFR